MRLKLTLILSISIAVSTCFSEDIIPQTKGSLCKEIDLRTSKCLPPGKSQSDTEFCYAFSAAEAISFHFCKEVSPVALGLLKGRSEKPEIKDQNFWSKAGGWQDEAIKIGNENGFCLEKEFPSQLLRNDIAISLRREYLKLLKNTPVTPEPESCHELAKKISQVIPAVEIKEIIAYISNQQTPEELLNLLFSRCKNPIKQTVSVKTCSGSYEEKLKFIRENIQNGPVPIALVDDSIRAGFKSGDIDNHHAVTVIGQKMESGVCKYLIRDSGSAAYRIGSITIGTDNEVDHWITEESLLKTLKGTDARCYSVY
jgi:hypothetical protein